MISQACVKNSVGGLYPSMHWAGGVYPSIHSGGGVCPGEVFTAPQTATVADATHPTGMHSYVHIYICVFVSCVTVQPAL